MVAVVACSLFTLLIIYSFYVRLSFPLTTKLMICFSLCVRALCAKASDLFLSAVGTDQTKCFELNL